MAEERGELQQAVKGYKALGEPTRLKIAMLLCSEQNLCCTLALSTGMFVVLSASHSAA